MSPQSRPRIAGERETEVLDTTVELLVEVGYDRLTMDAVARRARAGKATLYRRWASKASLVVDALTRVKDTPAAEAPDTGNLRADLMATFCGTGLGNADNIRVLGAVITAMNSDPEFAAEFRERFIAPKIAVTQAVYERGLARGEISPDADLEMIGPAMAGILLHRAFLLGRPIDDATVARVVDHVILPALRAGSSTIP